MAPRGQFNFYHTLCRDCSGSTSSPWGHSGRRQSLESVTSLPEGPAGWRSEAATCCFLCPTSLWFLLGTVCLGGRTVFPALLDILFPMTCGKMEFNFLTGQGRLLRNVPGARPLAAPMTPGTDAPHLSQEFPPISHCLLGIRILLQGPWDPSSILKITPPPSPKRSN